MTTEPRTAAGRALLASSVGWVAPHPDRDGTVIPVVQDAMRDAILAIEDEAAAPLRTAAEDLIDYLDGGGFRPAFPDVRFGALRAALAANPPAVEEK